MAKPKQRTRAAASHRASRSRPRVRRQTNEPGRRRRGYSHRRPARRHQSNPAGHRRRSYPRRRYFRQSNPRDGFGAMQLLTTAIFTIGGAVGSKYITQMVLSDKNVGLMGYAGNAVVAFGLSLLVGKLMKNPSAGRAILAGGVVQIVLRAIADFTPWGKFTQTIGLGDYQVSNWVTPQRYTDALNSANVEIPAGWAPTVVQSSAPPAGHRMAAPGGGMSGYGSGLYSSQGLYSA